MAIPWLDGIKRLPRRACCRTAYHARKVVSARQLLLQTPKDSQRRFVDQHWTHDDAARPTASTERAVPDPIHEEHLYHSDGIEVESITGLDDALVEEDWSYRLSRNGKGRESMNAGSDVLRH